MKPFAPVDNERPDYVFKDRAQNASIWSEEAVIRMSVRSSACLPLFHFQLRSPATSSSESLPI